MFDYIIEFSEFVNTFLPRNGLCKIQTNGYITLICSLFVDYGESKALIWSSKVCQILQSFDLQTSKVLNQALRG